MLRPHKLLNNKEQHDTEQDPQPRAQPVRMVMSSFFFVGMRMRVRVRVRVRRMLCLVSLSMRQEQQKHVPEEASHCKRQKNSQEGRVSSILFQAWNEKED